MNEIQQGLCSLFEDSMKSIKSFNRKNYEDTFLALYYKYEDILGKVRTEYEESSEKDAALELMMEPFIRQMHERFAPLDNKRKREHVIIDYNMVLVTYFIPALNYNRTEACRKLAQKILDVWNRDFADGNVGNATFEDINGGFKRRMCYITTAVCESLQKGDECYELNLLRDYRDEYLLGNEEGAKIVEEYYDIAPTIVNHINSRENADEIYRGIWEDYLSTCVELLENDEKEACKTLYCDMVRRLQKQYLYS